MGPRRRIRYLLVAFSTAAVLPACSADTATAPAPSPWLAATPGTPPTAAPTPTIEVISPSTYPLSIDGPWLVYRTGEAVFIANPDGSGSRVLYKGTTLPVEFDSLIAPTGNLLALYGFDDVEARSRPWLKILRLPLGIELFTTPLLSPEIEAALADGAEGGSPAVEAATAVTQDGHLAWSPEGLRLAFVAALDGPSSDIYLYDLRDDQRRRVSSGPNQVASLSWSPDGRWIAHQAVETFGSGAGWGMGAVWTASPNGQQLNRLYSPAGAGEVFAGWSQGNSLISYTFTMEGFRDLRASGADGAVENVLIPSFFDDAAYDPASGMIAYAVSETSGPAAEPGAYLWGPVMRDSLRVDPREWTSVDMTPGAGIFTFEGPSGVLAVTPEGDYREISAAGHAAVSPDGRFLAVWGGGEADGEPGIRLFTADARLVRAMETTPVFTISWRPDSAGLMAITEDGLIFYPVEGQSVRVDLRLTGADDGVGWVWP